VQGRFTSVDPLGRSASVLNPQSFNRYSYVLNNPTNATDPFGLKERDSQSDANDEPPGDPFETGRDIIAERMVQQDRAIADTRQANAINDANLTREQAEAAIKGNDNLAIDDGSGGGSVTVTAEITGIAVEPQNPTPATQQSLNFTTVSGGPNSANWNIRWELANPSKRGGWIVQEITLTDQSGNAVSHYWEAWRVGVKSRFPTTRGPYAQDDTFQGDPKDKVRAGARFYEGLKLPSSFVSNNTNTFAGALRSTTKIPNLPTRNATPVVVRTWTSP